MRTQDKHEKSHKQLSMPHHSIGETLEHGTKIALWSVRQKIMQFCGLFGNMWTFNYFQSFPFP